MAENLALKDQFAKLLNARVIEVKEGYARTALIVRREFLNGADLAHGGVIFSLADYAFALAANAGGGMGLGINADIHFIKSAQAGEEIFAEVKEVSRSRRLGTYHGSITNSKGEILAQFQSMAYFKTIEKV